MLDEIKLSILFSDDNFAFYFISLISRQVSTKHCSLLKIKLWIFSSRIETFGLSYYYWLEVEAAINLATLDPFAPRRSGCLIISEIETNFYVLSFSIPSNEKSSSLLGLKGWKLSWIEYFSLWSLNIGVSTVIYSLSARGVKLVSFWENTFKPNLTYALILQSSVLTSILLSFLFVVLLNEQTTI